MQGGSFCPEDEVHGGSGFEAEELQGSVAQRFFQVSCSPGTASLVKSDLRQWRIIARPLKSLTTMGKCGRPPSPVPMRPLLLKLRRCHA